LVSGDHKVAWIKGRDVLAADKTLLSRDSRFKLLPMSNGLELGQVSIP
jgi:hypothetical protein